MTSTHDRAGAGMSPAEELRDAVHLLKNPLLCNMDQQFVESIVVWLDDRLLAVERCIRVAEGAHDPVEHSGVQHALNVARATRSMLGRDGGDRD